MIRNKAYRIVADKLKKKGLSSTMMRPHQLVFSPPSHRGGGWLTLYQEKWHIGSWAPRLYRISNKKNISSLCKEFIDSKNSSSVIPTLVTRYNLVEISTSDMERMFEEQQ